jgi:hypothetical protein
VSAAKTVAWLEETKKRNIYSFKRQKYKNLETIKRLYRRLIHTEI